MLQIDPERRCSAAESLQSQYLVPYHDPNDEPTMTEPFDWSVLEVDVPAGVWKTIIYAEVLGYHEKRGGFTRLTPHLDGMDPG